MPDQVAFRTKPQIALDMVDHSILHDVAVQAWGFDELYGRDLAFLDALQRRRQAFVGEIPSNFQGWVNPRSVGSKPSCEVRNLARYSRVLRQKRWQCYRIKDTDRGPEVWEVKWSIFWRKDSEGRPTHRHCLILARNVVTKELKYFLSNRVPGACGFSLRRLLTIAFGRWSVESCFREAKEELGLDHYEVRGWRCVHRHFYVTQLTHLFCARIRKKFDEAAPQDDPLEHLTTEQVRRAMNAWLEAALGNQSRSARLQRELEKQRYYQRRNAQAKRSHTKTRIAKLQALGIDVDRIKSCILELTP